MSVWIYRYGVDLQSKVIVVACSCLSKAWESKQHWPRTKSWCVLYLFGGQCLILLASTFLCFDMRKKSKVIWENKNIYHNKEIHLILIHKSMSLFWLESEVVEQVLIFWYEKEVQGLFEIGAREKVNSTGLEQGNVSCLYPQVNNAVLIEVGSGRTHANLWICGGGPKVYLRWTREKVNNIELKQKHPSLVIYYKSIKFNWWETCLSLVLHKRYADGSSPWRIG